MDIYPKGQIALGNGDLFDVTNVRHKVTRNATMIHTLRQQEAGTRLGPRETVVSFDALVNKDGPERNYLEMLMQGTVQQLRIKIPGETINVTGVVSERSLEIALDDAIKYSIEFIGRTDFEYSKKAA